MKKEANIEGILLSLSPLEKKILPLLHLGNTQKITEQANLNLTSIKRAFQFLKSKGLIKVEEEKNKFIDVDTNGILYLKKGLPERRLLSLVLDVKTIALKDAKKKSGLTDNEFTIALGVLKEKGFINVASGNINLKASKEEATKKSNEEKFLESLPLEMDKLTEEQKVIFNKLKSRKALVRIEESTEIKFEITDLGKKVIEELPKFKNNTIIIINYVKISI